MEYKALIEEAKHLLVGKAPHQYIVLKSDDLKAFLKEEGFFNFHINNNESFIYYHHVVAFFECGGKEALEGGFICDGNEIHIHHFDGNTLNNDKSNLTYLPVGAHNEITKIQNNLRSWGKRTRKLNVFNNRKIEGTVIWNRKGKVVKRFYDWISQMILKTVKAFCKRKEVTLSLKGLGMWIIKITKRLKLNIDTSFVPSYLIEFLD